MSISQQNNTVARTGFEDEYPFASHFIEIAGHRYHYIDEGTGEILLCVHGNPSWSFAWRNIVKELSATHRMIAVDHIGCGFSDKPQEYAYTLQQHIENLECLVDQLGLKNITLLAHDWGGAIGMGVAGKNPELFSRFVLFNTAAFRSQKIPLRIAVCRIPILGTLAIRGLNLFARAAINMAVVKRPSPMTAAVRCGYLAPYNNWQNRIATLRFVEDIPLKPTHVSYDTLVSVEEGLAQFENAPMLLVWGEQDWCFTTAFRDEFQQRFSDAELLTLPDAGHYVFEDAHETIIPRLQKFLAEHPLT